MGQIQSLEELISLLLRRRWLVIAIAVMGMLGAVIFAKSRPNIYETAAVIQIESAQVSEGTPNGQQSVADGGGAAQVLQTIEQRLTTREALSAMIERHKLFADAPAMKPDEKLAALRSSVTLQMVDSAGGQAFGQGRTISAIIIFVHFSDPALAAALANDFAQGILDQSAAGQRARADQNVIFFKEEEARIFVAISAVESEMAAYKADNAEAMPDIVDAQRDEITSLDADLRQATQDLAGLKSEKSGIESKQTRRETDRRRLEVITAEMDVLDAKIAESRARKEEITASLRSSPETERVLANYDRSLAQLQSQYTVITERMAEAETTQRLAVNQQSGRFSLLERAITPEYPTGGGKKKIAIAGIIASLLAGIGLAFVLDLLKPVVRTANQMQRQLDLEPVVCIPEIRAPKGRIGSVALRFIDDPNRPIFGLPRFAVFAGGLVLILVLLIGFVG
jgi:tyrosine-protein kinase Etk/Wzc